MTRQEGLLSGIKVRYNYRLIQMYCSEGGRSQPMQTGPSLRTVRFGNLQIVLYPDSEPEF